MVQGLRFCTSPLLGVQDQCLVRKHRIPHAAWCGQNFFVFKIILKENYSFHEPEWGKKSLNLSCAILHCLDYWSFVVGSLKLGHVGSPTLALLFQDYFDYSGSHAEF